MYKYIKRFLDITLSLIGLITLLPLYLILSIIVRVKLGSPIIFKHKRPGKNEKIFTLYKFRSMNNKKDECGNLLSDEERLTKFGKILRKTSLDELPELWNILKGDMSIVGPRPLLVEYLDRYSNDQKHRHDVRPGLTGLAQVRGRNKITWGKKFEYDIEYVKNISFLLDLKIIFETVKVVLNHNDINSSNSATMEEFV